MSVHSCIFIQIYCFEFLGLMMKSDNPCILGCFWSIDVWLDINMIYLITRHLTTMEVSFQLHSQVLIPNMLKWFCPTAVIHLRDGMSYPTAHDS
ncbi:hypothetical protein DKX38_012230 [Salix brachista]|uniref:Uncharacterized protein n=1 Tax=Salix brachista TaxID=2182728 RepID=A0A5N5LND1_9ROSI|nr:hypothetical protein DKX38_012230 [Salix brachista]